MPVAFLRQMMGFVKDVDAVFRRRQDRAATEGEIGQHQILVGDDAIRLVEFIAGVEEAALAVQPAAGTGTFTALGGQWLPAVTRQRFMPFVPVAPPAAVGEFAAHRLPQREVVAAGFGLAVPEQVAQCGAAVAAVEQILQFQAAKIASAPFRQHIVELQAGRFDELGDVLADQLLLQGNRRRGDDQLAPGRHRQWQGAEQIGQGFAGAGARLHHADWPPAFPRRLRQGVENLGDHPPLPGSWPKIQLGENPLVLRLDLPLDGVDRGVRGIHWL